MSNRAATPSTRVIRVGVEGTTFPYAAGQAAAVGISTEELTPYSIASAPYETAERGYVEFLVKVDGSTRFGSVVANLEPGTPLIVTPAGGRFGLPPAPVTQPLLFIAGGTGIAPLRSMLLEQIHSGVHQSIALVYSARTPAEFAYLDEFRALQDGGKLALTLTLTGAADDWMHARGRTGPEHLAALVSPRTLCFICGPPAMIADVPRALMALGVARDQIRTEDW